MNFNTWGMPAAFGGKFVEQRMVKIADELSKGEYDIYLFEELWIESDHKTLADKIPEGFHMTKYEELGGKDRVLIDNPGGRSGLAIASRYPFEGKPNFYPFKERGDVGKIVQDGEALSGKGVGRVMLRYLHRNIIGILNCNEFLHSINSQTFISAAQT